MLDVKFIKDNIEFVVQNCLHRNVAFDSERFLKIDFQRRDLDQKIQNLRVEANKLSSKKNLANSNLRSEKGRNLRCEVERLEKLLRVVRGEMDEILRSIPNLTHKDTPIGVDEAASKIIKHGRTPIPVFEFKVKNHLDLGRDLGIIDMNAGTKVAGSGFYFLKGKGALLDLRLQNYVIQKLIAQGYQFQITPDIANNEVLTGTGYVPRGTETNTYCIEDTNLSLIATSEITLCGQFKDEVILENNLPIKLVGLSHCFRTERAAGSATRGIYRVHQFTKVEMVILCKPEMAEEIHEELLNIEMEIFDDLCIPYRVLDIASGDLGASAYRKFDIEAWMPGRGNIGEYGEVTSTSNCTDYQTRRLNIKYKPDYSKKRIYIYTLNGTGIATSRAILALLENYQTENGDIKFPPSVSEILGFSEITKDEI